MDEKRAKRAALSPIRGRNSRRSLWVVLLVVVVGAYAYLYHVRTHLTNAVPPSQPQREPARGENQKPVKASGGLVPLEAHIISMCPDTRVRHLAGEGMW